MRPKREGPRRTTLLEQVRSEHKSRYDAVDDEFWGCVCEAGVDCKVIIALMELQQAEKQIAKLAIDLARERDRHAAEVRRLSSEIAGLETYNRRLVEEKDALQQRIDNGIS